MITIDTEYLKTTLLKLLDIPSPTGYTDEIVHAVGRELERMGVPFELTRRGAIRATLKGAQPKLDRAIVSHLDTLGAMVRELKPNGRLGIMMIGHWSARFAEGARVTIFTDKRSFRGTIQPLKASGHVYNDEIDTQPVSWDNLEVRIDEKLSTREDLEALGFNVGDFIAVDSSPELTSSGFIKARHLDNKAGVACQLTTIKAIVDAGITLPVTCHPLFTISEEEGTGASSILHGDVAAMVAIDNSTVAPGQNSREDSVTIAMRDQGAIYDYHLTHRLISLCEDNAIPYVRDVFRHYRSDAASALSAGNDIRTGLICFGLDASHGHERTHIDSLIAISRLLCAYLQSTPRIKHDSNKLGPLEGFPMLSVNKKTR
ncbi:MAG: osmoprotectant NAGGN system M42 family peptidase [Prosthecochloris sp.]|uniref:Hydrolase, peptidase M42 family n=1 Tax=Prosthecochloris aestuarii (strain DSM 271 / SK 413) TaxID=290512 RepID=B4S378_PROA2|nr:MULTISPECIES: osmoprotectant NAGGN system M42 family peptidase [Prosthecochloris]ACF45172.1 hydrolase, peptidase M42 family [Prosthecochloris aestuarii DSM 271]MCW8797619.1 osmoprotectant NAGGN system M42 family peptidase [Prosthecochloris sp.]NEX12321.1 osmoprotectant NAGGN system M42 family peptidase [Prosthecochloris sp.]RDD31170.1 osmoprotectant NAGGN system M42 family peptidase [Prosthecochloris sp. ZM]